MFRLLAKVLLILLPTSLLAEGAARDAQGMLSRLGYQIVVDGNWGPQSQRVIGQFYTDRGHTYDGTLSENEFADLKTAVGTLPRIAYSEIRFENEHPYPQPKNSNEFCCGGFVSGNFFGGNRKLLINIISPPAYVQALWGSQNPKVPEIYQVYRRENWRDQINLLRNNNGRLTRVNTEINTSNGFCLHSAQLVEADFNNDGISDVLVACHGFDAPPYPGDHSYLLFGSASGVLTSVRLTNRPGFYHGATVFDVNGDGHLDPVLTDANSGKVVTYLNDGTGGFSGPNNLLTGLRANYTISSYDFNNDGSTDLIVGGHEDDPHGSLTTQIFFNNGDGRFSSSRATRIPKLQNFGIVLDYLVYGKWLFVVRTMSKPQPYVGGAIQQIDLETMTQVGLIAKNDGRHVSRLRRFESTSGSIIFGSPAAYRNNFDFTVDLNGNMRFVR